MFNTHRLIGSSLFVLFLFSTALAQENRAPIETPREPVPAAPLVTAAATAKRVRFVSPGTVVQLRLEVYNEAGQKLFDTELHGGNVLDWHLQDGAGQRLAAGSYACVLTIKSLSGRLSQRVGLVTVNDEKAAIEAAGVAQLSQLSIRQQQTIGPVEGNAAFTVLQESKAEAITAVTHDGTDGQMARTRGALSFRVGDFFSGKDKEQMRLTEEGNLGIGTDKPQARLDVAGTIRAEKGIEFADGTVQTTGLSGRKDSEGNLVPNASGTGTQNKLAKWTDNAGTLGDSVITEATGKLGIGTASPNYEITLFGNDVGLQLISPVTGVTANDGFRFGISSVNDAFLWNAEATDMFFGTSATERMRIKANGNVGIGTTNPLQRLAVQSTGATLVGSKSTGVSSEAGFQLANDSKTYSIQVRGNTSNAFTVRDETAGAYRFAIDTSGNVGIGTNNPAAKLDVVGNINTSTQYNIGGLRVLSISGSTSEPNSNTFLGVGAGPATSLGDSNSFFGNNAGSANTTGDVNSFFGTGAGQRNTEGNANSFFGQAAGINNTSGDYNVFIGDESGLSNTVENNNTFIGALADGAAGITNATAIGFLSKVTQSDSLVLGSITDFSSTPVTSVGIGTTAPKARFHVQGGNIYVGGPGQGIILKSPDGLICRLLTIDNTGAQVISTITCP